ncbi:MAG TPA: type 4a pilus biogenesis protein PilO [Desulfobacterales bacterium]|jgi:Tfp pilus assembly protein PilO|nr:type 4a pilus biogenesis protein PilO [Desulfobacterales bacterium]
MTINLKMDMGTLVRSLFSRKGGAQASLAGPFSKIIVGAVLVAGIVAVYVAFVYMPSVREVNLKQRKANQTSALKAELAQIDVRINRTGKKLKAAQEKYEKLSRLFHTSRELEDLYRFISMLALRQSLMIVKLDKGDEEPVYEKEDPKQKSGKDGQAASGKVAYYKIKVKFTITGDFIDYTKFRRELARVRKVINIEDEKIEVVEDQKARGTVTIDLTLATYRVV